MKITLMITLSACCCVCWVFVIRGRLCVVLVTIMAQSSVKFSGGATDS